MNEGAFYIIGGQQKRWADIKPDGQRFEKAIVMRIDVATGRLERSLEYVSPRNVCPDQHPSILFKAGALWQGRLYVCTSTEILAYELPGFEQVEYLSLPFFNDLHHVQPTPQGSLLVAVTGLDMVVELSTEGAILREWGALGTSPWERFSRGVDYRKVPSTKPHASHPNYVFQIGDEIWATRLYQKDAICLTHPDRRIDIGVERPHDGVVYDGLVYFTTVDGHVVVADPETTEVQQIVSLNEIVGADRALGWCRGLHVVDRDHVLVGFSRLRPTKLRQNVRWVKQRLRRQHTVEDLPTRVALYDIKRKRLCWDRKLEDLGAAVVFSIHEASVR